MAMTPGQVSQILAKAQLVDNRQADEATILTWHEIIGHLDYQDAMRGLVLFRRDSDEYLQPAHIVKYAKVARDQRKREELANRSVEHRGDAPRPDNFDDMVEAYRDNDPIRIAKELAAYNRQLVAAGKQPLYIEPMEARS
jgi:hypothetical protein